MIIIYCNKHRDFKEIEEMEKNSKFQYTNPRLIGIELNVNESYTGKSNSEQNLRVETSVESKKNSNIERGFNYSHVVMSAKLGGKESDSPFFLEVKMAVDFRWSDDFNEDKIEKLLRQNGSVLLLSYIRPLVASLSLQAGVGPINLPFLDFSQD